jgi:hypothetical protein
MSVLPLLDVDWELVSNNDFRELLAALNFQASYDPRERELTIRVTLVPELASPDGLRAPHFVRAPGRTRTKGMHFTADAGGDLRPYVVARSAGPIPA